MPATARQLTKIGVFYDGNYFDRVSKYYSHQHAKKAWISIPGLHEFIRYRVARDENVDTRHCQVIDAHYFRGRFSAQKTREKGESAFFNDRALDDILMHENVMAHYLPMNFIGKEKGIDVWLALEAFELSIYKKFDVLVPIASDSDYIPLVRKLKTLGTRVMALNWFITYASDDGHARETRPSQMLLREVNYPIVMSEIIDQMDDSAGEEREILSGLFQRRRDRPPSSEAAESAWKIGFVENLHEHFGFIRPEGLGKNVYFRYVTLDDASPDELEKGMEVSFLAGPEGEKGPTASKVRRTSAS